MSRTFSNSFELLMIIARFDQFLSRSELIYSSTSSSVCQELFSRFLTFYRKPLWLPSLRTAYLGYHSRGCLSRTFFGSFQTFSLRSPAAHLPANSLFTLPHSPLLVNDFFPYFQLFSTLCNPCQNPGLYVVRFSQALQAFPLHAILFIIC